MATFKTATAFAVLTCLTLVACKGEGPARQVKGEKADGGATETTASVLCPSEGSFAGDYSAAGKLTSKWKWTCDDTHRHLVSNGLPNTAVGVFPNPGNQNTIEEQDIKFSVPLKPEMTEFNSFVGGPGGVTVFTLNGVKFDPGTGGSCPDDISSTDDCPLGGGRNTWRIEALGHDTFDFGEDRHNAHVQPGGEYHYHGLPTGLLENAEASEANKKMVLVGWAGDGYPVYGRYCYSDAMDASSPLKVCKGSFATVETPAEGRPSTDIVPIGVFSQDWAYTKGSGDLDDCNGRTGVTPEFPKGIYYYMATDSYPYFSRCLKGKIDR